MSLGLGGAETHVVSLARELKRRGHNVSVASQGGCLVADLAESGILHHTVPLHSRSPLMLMEAVRAISGILKKESPDLIHAHARIPAWVCNLAAARHGAAGRRTPIVTTYHGVYAAGFPWNFFTYPGDRTIAVSEDVAEHLIKRFRFDRAKVEVVPNGIDTDRFSPDRGPSPAVTNFGISGRPVILHASRLSGPFADTSLALVEACPAIAREWPSAQVVIVGDGDRFEEVRTEVERMNRHLRSTLDSDREGREFIVLTGGQEDMPPLYACADVVVGVARVALEAMATGKAVILAGEGGLRGLLVEDNVDLAAEHNFTARGAGEEVTARGLLRELSRVLGDASARSSLGAMGRRIVLERYSIRRMVDMIEEIYADVLRGEAAC